ncbi:ATP phosphoribosyltransferase regulatory subunit [Neisseria sp. Ec49-e6-T10]|uniref:ATP phosphoribosyltransferase regulatory subunit n=1 Tax=Neisseria sp. Ec49-e6-T10 TaxID=3140744 RepID=UPI003EB911AA
MQAWQLPEYIADILPANARQLESAKEELLELFRVHGFELVLPPLMEYTSSLLVKNDKGLSLKTIRVVDQLSGLQLGLRADITPQVARIDAHLLSANTGVNRLCYAGSVLHARPAHLMSTREPLQVGAEIYGYAGVEADLEIIGLMLKALRLNQVQDIKLALGHIGVFRALAAEANLNADVASDLLQAMQHKDKHEIALILADIELPIHLSEAFSQLPELYGDLDILDEATKILPALPSIQNALAQLKAVADYFPKENIHIDLAELRVDSYHTGLLFAAYAPAWADAIARGGRYDNVGKVFGRARPATGFSFDLRDLMKVLPKNDRRLGIKVSAQDFQKALNIVEALRAQGEAVVVDYLAQGAQSLYCNRELVFKDNEWQVVYC